MEVISYLSDDQEIPFLIFTYKYDGGGMLVEETISGKNLGAIKLYKYDESGNLSELRLLKANGDPDYVYKTVYEYY